MIHAGARTVVRAHAPGPVERPFENAQTPPAAAEGE